VLYILLGSNPTLINFTKIKINIKDKKQKINKKILKLAFD